MRLSRRARSGRSREGAGNYGITGTYHLPVDESLGDIAVSAPRSYLVFFDFNKSDLAAQATQIVDQAASNAGPAKVTQDVAARGLRHGTA